MSIELRVVISGVELFMNALVAYYSRPGTAKKVAEKLSSLLGCPCEEIRDTKGRKGVLASLICIKKRKWTSISILRRLKISLTN